MFPGSAGLHYVKEQWDDRRHTQDEKVRGIHNGFVNVEYVIGLCYTIISVFIRLCILLEPDPGIFVSHHIII